MAGTYAVECIPDEVIVFANEDDHVSIEVAGTLVALSPGEARALAANLERAADEADEAEE